MTDILMWVGTQYYPTIQHYVDEAERLGVCKRVSRPPRDVSRLFLAHDEGFIGEGVIFGYVSIERLEIVVEDGVQPPPGYTAVPLSQVQQEEARRCGYREDAGATYLVARATPLQLIDPGVEYEAMFPTAKKSRQRFRSWKRVDGDAILRCEARVPRPTERYVTRNTSTGRWSDRERESLLAAVSSRSRGVSKQEEIRLWALANGRTFGGAMYQWQKLTKGVEE